MTRLDIMIGLIVLLAMYFLHVIEDFHVQGLLGQLKQKKTWVEYCKNEPESFQRYRNDYKVCLLLHAFEWSCFIMAPMFVLMLGYYKAWTFSIIIPLFMTLGLNIRLHYDIDDMKCNRMEISLVTDQIIHAIQIFVTWGLYMVMVAIWKTWFV